MSKIIVKAQSKNLPMTNPVPENKQHSQHHMKSLGEKWPITSPVQQNRQRSQHHM